jgi:hypothetical protein
MAADNDLQGIQFNAIDGRISTSATGQAILATAVRPLNASLATAIEAETHWRKHYGRYLVELVRLAVERGDESLALINSGLDALQTAFSFVRCGQTVTPRQAMEQFQGEAYRTGIVQGLEPRVKRLEIPYRGKVLFGDSLNRQLDRWLDDAIIEPSAAIALKQLIECPDWLDLNDLHLVLLGAASEVGPCEILCQLGANVVAVDLDRPAVWQKLFRIARKGSGRLLLPLPRDLPADADDNQMIEAAGADLLCQTPEIRSWLLSIEQPFCIGGYAYLPGQHHVRVEVAMDAIMEDLCARRPDVSLAFLLTPTDVFATPLEAAQTARQGYRERGALRIWQDPLHALSRGRLYAPNSGADIATPDGQLYGLYDGIVPAQGPNYALAKRIQKWRAVLARAQGHRVSANVAPSTATASVLTRRDFKAAFAGAGHYGAEIFEPDTTNAVMAALLIHDLRASGGVSDPATALTHPLELFTDCAVHGGLWRAPYQLRSVLEIAAIRGLFAR